MNGDLHTAWADLFIASLAQAGVEDFVVSPGSRSTPLTLAIARAGVRANVIIDERGAAFFALGQARATGRPSALMCTSGTAAAHYFPALVEASQTNTSMIVVTADRPWELVDCAASQTIDQAKLFGDFVRWFVDVGAPDPSPSAIRGVARVASQAVARSLGPSPGPVHVNARFRKPLEPCPRADPEPWTAQVDMLRSRPPTRFSKPISEPDIDRVRALLQRLRRAERPIVVAGPSPLVSAADRRAVLELCRRLALPLFAEATSQLRFGDADVGATRVGALDLVFGAARASTLAPDVVVQLGAPPVSSAYAAIAEAAPERVVVARHAWADPWACANEIIASDVGAFAKAALGLLESNEARSSRWLDRVGEVDAIAARVVEADVAREALGEGEVARALIAACPAGARLTIGNSSPVRDLDLWCAPSSRAIDVLHQRGAAGIDGLIAGAAGSHSAADLPSALLVGDVSFSHDVGGLAVTPRGGAPLVIVVVDNGGGRIFEALPIFGRVDDATFTRFFATPPTLDVELAARAFGSAFDRASTCADLDRALAAAFARAGTTVVHAVVPAGAAAPRLAKLRAAFAAALESAPSAKGAEP